MAAYKEAVGRDDEAAAAEAISQVDVTVKKYAALEVPIELEPALQECYTDYLGRSGQTDFLKMTELLQSEYGH